MAKLISLLLIASIFIATATAACTAGSDGCTTCTSSYCSTCSAGYYVSTAYVASTSGACTICATGTYMASTSDATTVNTCATCTTATSTGSTSCFSANIVYGAVLALFALLFWWIQQIKLLEFRAFMFVRVMWRIVLSYFH